MTKTVHEAIELEELQRAGEDKLLPQLQKVRKKEDEELNVRLLETLLNQNYLESLNILTVYRLLGEDNLTALINSKLRSFQFSVDLSVVGEGEPFCMGEYSGFSLQIPELIIPKCSHGPLTEEILNERLGDIVCFNETPRTKSYQLLLNESSEANTAGQIIRGINHNLGRFVEKQIKPLKLANYRMVFRVQVTF